MTEHRKEEIAFAGSACEGDDLLTTLPNTILLHVLQYLPVHKRIQMSSLSKRWHELVFEASLWRRINVANMQHVDDTVLLQLTSISKYVTHLDVTNLTQITGDGFFRVISQCRRLQTLKARG